MTWYVVLAALTAAALFLGFSRSHDGPSFMWSLGVVVFFLGQRMLFGETSGTVATVLGLALVAGSFGLRVRNAGAAWQLAARWQAVASSSLVLYALSTPWAAEMFGLADEAATRFYASFLALSLIAGVTGALPMWLLDAARGAHPRLLPPGAEAHATRAGLALGLGLSLIFPLNYLAAEHDISADYSYFRVTRPGSATFALVRNLKEPVEVLLFFPPSSETKEKILPYFTEVAAQSDGKLTWRVLDQASDPKLSEELAIRDNGYVVFRRGDAKEKLRLDADLKKARRDLKKLDGEVQKYLLKLVSDKRMVYLLTGHGEATYRASQPTEKLAEVKNLMRLLNYDLKEFGVEDGSADVVPDDAALLVIAGPKKALLAEETKAVEAYLARGGAVLAMVEPGGDMLEGILSYVGLAAAGPPVLHLTKNLPLTNSPMDRANLVSNKFGSHASVATLSKYATRGAVVMFGATAIREGEEARAGGPVKTTPLIRSFEDSWLDADGDYAKGAEEAGGQQVLAMAAQGPDSAPFRLIALGDVQVASDFVLQRSAGNAQLIQDGVRWLVGDEELAGETNSEEDVRIEHTREEDGFWFYLTIGGMPLFIVLAGVVMVRRRQRAA